MVGFIKKSNDILKFLRVNIGSLRTPVEESSFKKICDMKWCTGDSILSCQPKEDVNLNETMTKLFVEFR